MDAQEYYNKEEKALQWFADKQECLFTKSEGTYDAHDGWITSGVTEFIIEAKVRKDITADKMERWGGSFLEFTKIEGLRQFKEENSHDEEILYVNFLKDELQIYQLPSDPTMYSWELKYLPFETAGGNKRMIYKWVTKLTPEYKIQTIKY